MNWELPVSFGVDGTTGKLLPGIDEASFVNFFKKPDESNTRTALDNRQSADEPDLGGNKKVVKDPDSLRQAGWGAIFSNRSGRVTPGIESALKRLLDHRQEQAGDLFRTFRGEDSFLETDVDAHGWLSRTKPLQPKSVSLFAPINPKDGVPLYLLIVAPPEDISFEFQYQLSLQFFVGRLWFDTDQEFSQYVDSLLRYEDKEQPVSTSRQAALFAPRHFGDKPTNLFNRLVAEPFSKDPDLFAGEDFALRTFVDTDATRDNLQAIFSGGIPNGTPALLISGSHGVNFPSGTSEQARAQGAILCQDWSGFGDFSVEDFYFDAAGLSSDARLHGMIHFFFACHSAGWPRYDGFAAQDSKPIEIAPKPGLARLPQAMLAHPKGGALAVIGHIDRAWPNSFRDLRTEKPVLGTFESVIVDILGGHRVGRAMDELSGRWAKVAAVMLPLRSRWQEKRKDLPESGFETNTAKKLCDWWTAHDDARNYVILGDPAVRLRVGEKDMPPLPKELR